MDCVFITGASRGLGRGIAEAFLAGQVNLALLARTEADLRRTADELNASEVSTLILPMDMTDADSMQDAIQQSTRRFDGIDTLVQVAGADAQMGPFESFSWETWRTTIDMDLHGMFNALQAVLPVMREQGHGKIIIVSSAAAMAMTAYNASFCPAKAAQVALTECLRKEYQPLGITVHCLCPVLTPHGNVGKNAIPRFAEMFGVTEEQVLAQRVPSPILTAADVGQAVVALTKKTEGGVWKIDGLGLYPWPLDDLNRVALTIGM